MKIKAGFFFFISLIIFSCNNPAPGKKNSFLHDVVDSLALDKTKNILIYTINPNDCINCLNNFVSINKVLMQTNNPKLYVIPVEREIEKKDLMNSVTTINLKDSINNHILWDVGIFDKISKLKNINISSSMLTIYSYSL